MAGRQKPDFGGKNADVDQCSTWNIFRTCPAAGDELGEDSFMMGNSRGGN
jgi:hypothetical protein